MWQASRVDLGEGTLWEGEARIDEGLMDWLGVNRSAVCPEARFSHIFGAPSGSANATTLHWREIYTYRSRFRQRDGSLKSRRTGAKYAISLRRASPLRSLRRWSAAAGAVGQKRGELSRWTPVPPWENNSCTAVGCDRDK
jgi:hypothetical protein